MGKACSLPLATDLPGASSLPQCPSPRPGPVRRPGHRGLGQGHRVQLPRCVSRGTTASVLAAVT